VSVGATPNQHSTCHSTQHPTLLSGKRIEPLEAIHFKEQIIRLDLGGSDGWVLGGVLGWVLIPQNPSK